MRPCSFPAWRVEAPEAAAALTPDLEVHGHREWDYDPYVAPWRETPALVLEMVRGLVDRDLSPNEEGRAARLRMQAAERVVMSHCPAAAQFFLSELVRLARTYTSLDDIEHYQTLRLNLPMRRALRELGALLQECGIVTESTGCFIRLRVRFLTPTWPENAPMQSSPPG